MMVLHWEVAGDVQLSRALTNLGLDVQDARVPLRRMAQEVIYPATRHQFEAEGDPAWPQLSPQYAARKARIAPGAGILHLTGALEASLTDDAAAGAIYRVEKLELEVGSDLTVGDYNLALIHYAPVRAPVPARKMMRLGPGDQTKCVMIFRDWLAEEGRKEGVGLS